jgi:hypothetical protein
MSSGMESMTQIQVKTAASHLRGRLIRRKLDDERARALTLEICECCKRVVVTSSGR